MQFSAFPQRILRRLDETRVCVCKRFWVLIQQPYGNAQHHALGHAENLTSVLDSDQGQSQFHEEKEILGSS